MINEMRVQILSYFSAMFLTFCNPSSLQDFRISASVVVSGVESYDVPTNFSDSGAS